MPQSLCIKRGDLAPRKFDLTLDHASIGRPCPDEMRDALALQRTSQKNFEVNKKIQALKVRKALTAKMWKEKENSL